MRSKNNEVKGEKKLLESYNVISDYLVADIKIWSIPFENTPIYQVVPHKLSLGSQALIKDLMKDMIKKIPVKLEDITDPRKVIELKDILWENGNKRGYKWVTLDLNGYQMGGGTL